MQVLTRTASTNLNDCTNESRLPKTIDFPLVNLQMFNDPKEWIEFLTWVHLLKVAKMKAVNRNNDNINKNKYI